VPLCGKSLDLVWLDQQGCRVTGAELSELAVKQFFDELGVEPQVTAIGTLRRYEGKEIVILQGSFFDVTPEILGPVDLVYDRAALVALPRELRERYANDLIKLTGAATQLLICYEYDQNCAEGPPFSVEEAELRRLYEASFDLSLLERSDVEGGLKGKCPATEAVWRLR
jgi:thiopurine S-methyltransferase